MDPLESGESLQVTILGEHETGFPGRVEKNSRGALELVAGSPAPSGAAIKLEAGRRLFLGEVRSCRAEGQAFTICVELRHAIYNTLELARLAQRILDERV
jgi:hypothetical protein